MLSLRDAFQRIKYTVRADFDGLEPGDVVGRRFGPTGSGPCPAQRKPDDAEFQLTRPGS